MDLKNINETFLSLDLSGDIKKPSGIEKVEQDEKNNKTIYIAKNAYVNLLKLEIETKQTYRCKLKVFQSR